MKQFLIKLAFLIFLFFVVFACKKDEQEVKNLTLLSQHDIAIPETSGLSECYNGWFLSVSDSSGEVFIMDSNGEVIQSFDFSGDDLEGITYNPVNSHIYLAEEKLKEIVELDSTGQEINRFPVEYNNQFEKHGLEGVTFNADNQHLYTISEKLPAILFELSTTGELIQSHNLSFADDYSSIYYESIEKELWILSDQSETLTRCTLQGEPLESFNTGIEKGEGLVIDPIEGYIYIITDTNSKLSKFEYSGN